MKNTKNLEAAPEADSDVTQASEHSEPAERDIHKRGTSLK